ncbi:Sporulation inhibitor kipI [Serratia entomophila]|nr:Sporulation inhibitor kipI [Serratia entomophila]CAI1549296.1 Sporulation inhibitor kipI [Serratia entomophila]CAI1558716.1 Sporulation inhibitor kipI [Serratia entomophila]CAI1626543.1 Sporulation inhibitor kipI [Serratia entomophila]CAI1672134.1 Sporulation inhibitor kipI [Serratia entomophila]
MQRQRARCYLLGERAVVLELSPPVTLPSQQRIWALAEKLNHHPDVLEVVPGMNNLTLLLHTPQADAEAMLGLLQQGWDSKESLVPESRQVDIPVIYGGEQGPDLDEVARHTGLTPRQVVECHASADYVVYFLGFQPGFSYMGGMPEKLATPRRTAPGGGGGLCRHRRRPDRHLPAGHARRLATDRPHAAGAVQSA